MSKKMLAVRKVAREPGLVVDEIPVPVPGKEEVLVEVQAAGICGTDLHIWKWDSWSRQRIKTPDPRP